ncbi:hypothetical protein [Duganella sp. S19_KUP01_CR8]|uniref:hypothetical protein n=1 Tax=Duganella sp. S19_KUP01_CR8 TaxID=3025502 RepID=UPI002FCDA61A
MARAFTAYFLACVLVSLTFGGGAIFVLPLCLIEVALIAGPIFWLCRRLGYLNWWSAVLAGLCCSGFLFGVDVSGNPLRAEMYGPMHAAWCVAAGISGGLVFWWVGLYRNAAFPAVPGGRLWSMLLMLPPLAMASAVYLRCETESVLVGRLLAEGGPPIAGMSNESTVSVILPGGETVRAMVSAGTDEPTRLGMCVSVISRAEVWSGRRLYWVSHFLDEHFEGYDKC